MCRHRAHFKAVQVFRCRPARPAGLEVAVSRQRGIEKKKVTTPRPVPFPSFFPRDVNSPFLYNASHSYDDSGHLQPPSHHLQSNIIRHQSLPSQRWEERSRSMSSSNQHEPGTLQDDRPNQRASSYSLPPIRTFMQPSREEYSNRGPPSHGLLDQTQETLPGEASVDDTESSNERPTYRRGKRKRSDSQDEKKTKAVRKIYVACDFCRGRKLRCDGTKPSCANCSTRTLKCVYKDHPRRRGPGKAPKGSRTKKSDRKGRKSSKGVTSEVDKEGSEQPSAAALPDRHVFEMLPGHLSGLEPVYVPLPYTDRPSASNVYREEPEASPNYHFTSGALALRDRLPAGSEGDRDDELAD
ncbi:uncharacterized protein EDB93DRAFT_1102843 [Suillus bovinus]|uniref:uncharacterized protein n=1 Tax=Suillus bovinus TaxID=48563 RepID=UPI001B882126|nr:uncharacterized protein EDB93DRAFT_1102843 [Suillus bovinus]KAG2153102.1 hypothetical protein EDB93DRAFT_1102843 [Suillus bovinus]